VSPMMPWTSLPSVDVASPVCVEEVALFYRFLNL